LALWLARRRLLRHLQRLATGRALVLTAIELRKLPQELPFRLVLGTVGGDLESDIVDADVAVLEQGFYFFFRKWTARGLVDQDDPAVLTLVAHLTSEGDLSGVNRPG